MPKAVISSQFLTNAALNNIKNNSAIRHTFKAYERLKREQHIDTLFRTGKAFSVFPVKFIYLLVPRAEGELSPVRAAFAVPKKKFRKAVQRNRVRRLMREAWRMNKHELYPTIPEGKQLHLFLMYTDVAIPEIAIVNETMVKGIEKLKTALKQKE